MVCRFPPPWRADETPGGYVVRDANGQSIAHVYSRDKEAEALQAKVLTADEARRIAANFAKLPELLGVAVSEKTPPKRGQGLPSLREPYFAGGSWVSVEAGALSGLPPGM
jgi:hypothetical protein